MQRIGPGIQLNQGQGPAGAAPPDFEATLTRVMNESMAGAMQVAQDQAAKLPAGTPSTIAIEVEVVMGPDGQVTVDEKIDVRPGAAAAPIAMPRGPAGDPLAMPGAMPGVDAGVPVVMRPG